MKAGAFTALVLAGSRPGGDPLAKALGVSHKALLPVAGRPMLAWVLEALGRAENVGRLLICGLDRSSADAGAGLASLLDRATFIDAGKTPGASVTLAMETVAECIPLLVTTGDHPLLTAAIVDEFCARAAGSDADVAVGFVDGESVRAAFPGAERTYLRLRGGTYHGANLFAFLTPESRRAAHRWTEVEEQRKHPWKMIRVLGVGTLLRFATRRLSLDDAVALVAQRMGVRIAPILLPYPEAGFDVDKPSHVGEVERVLRRRTE
jgi:molybdopterin-guanine dinucleotide biosynthesis protein A